jgi:hypothetical protein
MTDNKGITCIKGTDQDMKCRGYQFAFGQTYTADGTVKACSNGFHACPTESHPLSVFEYYAPAGSRYFEVEVSGKTDRQGNKIAGAQITFGVEITIPELVKRAFDWVWERATKSDDAHVTGNYGAASSTRGAASSTGDYGAASSTGDYGAASSTGDYGAASSTGDYGAASSTGTRGAASSTGDYGAASSTGTRGAASSTGTRGAASSTGTRGAASSTGYYGAASSTGDYGAASSTGDYGAASSTGNYGAASSTGYQGKVMGSDGNALFAVEREAYPSYKIISAACGIVGQDGLDAGKWYQCRDGKLVGAE